jgi:hypothetical protein
LAVSSTPLRIEIVHFGSNSIRMGIPGTEDNGLLVWATGLKKHFEEILTHFF